MLTISYFKIAMLLGIMFVAGATLALLAEAIKKYFGILTRREVEAFKKRWSDPPSHYTSMNKAMMDDYVEHDWQQSKIFRIEPDMKNVSLNGAISVTNLSDEDLQAYIEKAEKEKEELRQRTSDEPTTKIYLNKRNPATFH